MVHSVLTGKDKENYEKGFMKGFNEKDLGFFVSNEEYVGWHDGQKYKNQMKKKELTKLKKVVQKKVKK